MTLRSLLFCKSCVIFITAAQKGLNNETIAFSVCLFGVSVNVVFKWMRDDSLLALLMFGVATSAVRLSL